mgnify:CR=1 FL=1
MAAMATDYLARNGGLSGPCRFDVVAIDDQPSGPPVITLIEAAHCLPQVIGQMAGFRVHAAPHALARLSRHP